MRHVCSAALLLALAGQGAYAQSADRQAQPSDTTFKNVQVLKGIPVGEFMDTMSFFSAALGSNCVHCHVDESLTHWEKFAEDVPRKRVARQMILLVNAINKSNFGGARVITCYTCHHGDLQPESIPSLLTQYSLPVEDPNRVEIVPGTKSPSADQLLDKYRQAVGDTTRLRSFTATGTYEGYDTYEQQVPIDVYAAAPNRRAVVIHTQNGDSTTAFDGNAGWVAAVEKPVGLLPLNPGGELDGARLDAALAFPGTIKQAFNQWRTGFPLTAIDDRPVQILEGKAPGGTRFKLFFDSESGLLTRSLRYTNTQVGVVPTQVDYSDYREVAGMKIPFHWVVTWTGGQSKIELNRVEPNVSIDGARFGKPAPAVVKELKNDKGTAPGVR